MQEFYVHSAHSLQPPTSEKLSVRYSFLEMIMRVVHICIWLYIVYLPVSLEDYASWFSESQCLPWYTNWSALVRWLKTKLHYSVSINSVWSENGWLQTLFLRWWSFSPIILIGRSCFWFLRTSSISMVLWGPYASLAWNWLKFAKF